MLLRTPEANYRVICILKEELSVRTYLAVREGEETGRKFLLLEFKNPVLSREMLVTFMELKRNAAGSPDFVNCFTKGGCLWAVFHYYEGSSLSETAKQTASFRLRLSVWQSLLERLFFQGLSGYLQYEAASPANLIVDDSFSVQINFLLAESDRRGGELFSDLQKRLSECFGGLFARELCRRDNALKDYAGRLEGARFADAQDIYRSFRELKRTLEETDMPEDGENDGAAVRLWEAASSHADMMVKMCYWLLIAALWAVFIWLCVRPEKASGQQGLISGIGTVEITGGRQTDAEEPGSAGESGRAEEPRSAGESGSAEESGRAEEPGSTEEPGSAGKAEEASE